MSERHLRAIEVDADTGEVVEGCSHVAACEVCSANAYAFEELKRKYQGALGTIGKMRADPEAAAREHKLWAEAEAVHTWWRLATGHFGSTFGADEFYEVLPRLRERDGCEKVLKAIAGAAFDPGSKTMKNGRPMFFDDFELLNRSKAKAASFALRVPFGAGSEKWKRWLLQRIESNLEGKK